jgi:DNA-binding SARP family transcriptional activator
MVFTMPIQITLAGRLTVATRGRMLDGSHLPGRHSRSLLAYLVAERDRLVPAEELAQVVWGDRPPRTWRPALRGDLSRIRAFLASLGLPANELLRHSGDGYELTLPPRTTVDVEQAAANADLADRALAAGDLAGAVAAAGAASAVARRPLLPGQEGAWVDRRRTALREVLTRALEVLADAHLAAGRPGPAIERARELVALDPYRESATIRLLRAHAAAGDHAEALGAYHTCRRLLAEELGVDPSPELEAVYLEVLQASSRSQDVPVGAGLDAPGAPLAGRRAELARLHAAWVRARGGQRQLVLITGEPGSGKTRLAEELAGLAARDGATVLRGRCDQRMRTDYLPFRQAFGLQLAGVADQDLTRYWPEVSLRVPDDPVTAGASPHERRPLFEAVARLLDGMAALHPLVLMIDDVQWADRPSLELLRSIVLPDRPIHLLTMLIGEAGVEHDAGLDEALSGLTPPPGHVTLDPLDAGDIRVVVQAAGPWPPGLDEAALAGVLDDRTGGNPGLVTEFVRSLARSAGCADELMRSARESLPEPVRAVMARRLGRLDPLTRHVLEVAAVITSSLEPHLLARVTGLSDADVSRALDTAVQEGLLTEVHAGSRRFVFRPPLVRDLLDEGPAIVPRAELHRRVGEVLQELWADDPQRASQLADHFAQGSEPADIAGAAHYARLAGDLARSRRLYGEAAGRYRQALSASARSGSSPAVRYDLLLALADMQGRSGQIAAATGTYLEAAAAGRRTGSAERLGRAALRLGGPAGFWSLQADAPTVMALLQEALDGLGQEHDGLRAVLMARLESWRVLSTWDRSPVRDADGFEVAAAAARRAGDGAALAAVLVEQAFTWNGIVLGRPGGPREMLAAGAELDRLATRLGNDELAFHAGVAYGEALLGAGDVAGVDRLVERQERLAQERGVDGRGWVPMVQRAGRSIMSGEFDFGEQLTERSLASGRRFLGEAALMTYLAQMGFLRWLQGRPDQVKAVLDEAGAGSMGRLDWTSLHLLASVGQGRRGAARHLLDAAVSKGFDGRVSAADLVALVGACTLLGAEDTAWELYLRLLPWSGWHLTAGPIYLGAADHHLGVLAAVSGRWDDAERRLKRAVNSHRRLKARPWFALTVDAFAGMLAGRGRPGDRRRAALFAATAKALSDSLGMNLPTSAHARPAHRASPGTLPSRS